MALLLLVPIALALLASHNNPAVAIYTVTAVTDVIATVGFPWVPAVVMVSAVAVIPAAVVFRPAVDVQELLLWLSIIGLRNSTISLSII